MVGVEFLVSTHCAVAMRRDSPTCECCKIGLSREHPSTAHVECSCPEWPTILLPPRHAKEQQPEALPGQND